MLVDTPNDPHRNVYSNSVLDVMGFSEPVAWF